jgi:biopolymer transport protein ExbB/TolQ
MSTVQTLAKYYVAGGPFMWAILAVLAVAVAVSIERVIFYYFICGGKGAKLVAGIAAALNGDNVNEAKKIVFARKAPLNVLLQTAVDRYAAGFGVDDIQEAVEETAIVEVPRLSERLNYLSLFANISTLVGLLGTIFGLMKAFGSLASAEASQKAVILARGISEFMVCTAFGLIVAVFCMIMYTILFNTQQGLTKDLDQTVVRVINYLRKKRA